MRNLLLLLLDYICLILLLSYGICFSLRESFPARAPIESWEIPYRVLAPIESWEIPFCSSVSPIGSWEIPFCFFGGLPHQKREQPQLEGELPG